MKTIGLVTALSVPLFCRGVQAQTLTKIFTPPPAAALASTLDEWEQQGWSYLQPPPGSLEESALINKLTAEVNKSKTIRAPKFQSAHTLVTHDDLKKIYWGKYLDYNFMAPRFLNHLNRASGWPVNDGWWPLELTINDVVIGNYTGVNPSQQVGWQVYKYFEGAPVWNTKVDYNQSIPEPDVKYSFIIPNYTTTTKKFSPGPGVGMVTISDSQAVTESVEASASLTVGGKVGIPLVAEGTTSFTVSLGYTHTENSGKTITYNPPSPWIDVPAKKAVHFTLMKTFIKYTTYYSLPIRLYGTVGSDFGWNTYQGHHWWGLLCSPQYSNNVQEMFPECNQGNACYNNITSIEEGTPALYWAAKIVPIPPQP